MDCPSEERRAGGGGGFSGWSKGGAELDARILAARRKADRKAKPMPDWVLRDLRRSFVTPGERNGADPTCAKWERPSMAAPLSTG